MFVVVCVDLPLPLVCLLVCVLCVVAVLLVLLVCLECVVLSLTCSCLFCVGVCSACC